MTSMNIINHVDILDLITIRVYNPNIYKPAEFAVDLSANEKGKVVVIDTSAKTIMNESVTKKAREFTSARDPKVKDLIREYVGRMCTELAKSGLLIIEKAPEKSEDPFAEAKRFATERLNKLGAK